MSSTRKRRKGWDPLPFKRRRSEAGGECVAVTFRTLRGEVLGEASLAATCLGRELKLKARAVAPRGIVTLFHGTAAVKDDVPVGEQGLQGADVQLVVSPVKVEQPNRVRDAVLRFEALDEEGEDWQVWDCVTSLTLDESLDLELPSALQSLTFGNYFNESLAQVRLPSGLQSLTFGTWFDQSLQKVTLPSGLQNLTFGDHFDQSLEHVTLPSGLQTLTLGLMFDHGLTKVELPRGLQHLTVGYYFRWVDLWNVTLPSGLQSLTVGPVFNWSLDKACLCHGRRHRAWIHEMNKSPERVTLPSSVQVIVCPLEDSVRTEIHWCSCVRCA